MYERVVVGYSRRGEMEGLFARAEMAGEEYMTDRMGETGDP